MWVSPSYGLKIIHKAGNEIEKIISYASNKKDLDIEEIKLLNNLSGAKDYYNQNTNSISGLKVIDDSTLVFELLEPAPSIIYLLASTKTAIISKLAFEKYGSNITVGCGPFKYNGLNKDSSTIQLIKNKSYFLDDKYGNSLPYLDSVTIMINGSKQRATELFERNEIMVLYQYL